MSDEELTAEIAIPKPLRRVFHYSIPAELDERAVPGARVLVPFGRQKTVGYVLYRNTPSPEGIELLPIFSVIDAEPTFDSQLLALLRWMAWYYQAPMGEMLRTGHPAGINQKGVAALGLTELGRERADSESLLRALAEVDEPRPISEIDASPADIKRAMQSGWVERTQVFAAPRVEKRTVKAVRAVAPAPVAPRGPGGRALRRDEILEWLVGRGVVPIAAVGERFPSPSAHLKRLREEGAIVAEAVEVIRDPFLGEAVDRDTPPTLNREQTRAVDALLAPREFKGFLLYGVTGSGKTEVYLHTIEGVLGRGRGALVLVPEIALTPQLVHRFRARLGDDIAVLHSGMSDGVRYDQWRRLRRGDVRVAIGARSGLFAPVRDLGIIVVDEEHDPSFKQGDGVRYQARDMALLRGHREGAVVVLGTATPSMESTYNAQHGKLTRLVLSQRPTGGKLPTVELVDMREQRPKDGVWFISDPLRDALVATLARGEQAILFLNRRGYSNFVLCTLCGEAVQCGQCSISMTWHQQARQLRCHYCDAARPLPSRCPACRNDGLKLVGHGTERLVEAMAAMFPAARIARMDRDTTTGRRLTDLVNAMKSGEIDILVGTQMVTKGHDFPKVTLVGVLSADASLNFPDFRAGERTFQLLSQVAGRAGRGDRPGRVVIQAYAPDHPCLQAVREHDHASFAKGELAYRALRGYPPYAHAATFRFEGRSAEKVEAMAKAVTETLLMAGAGRRRTFIRGPTLAPISVIRGRSRWAVLLTAEKRDSLRRLIDVVLADEPHSTLDARFIVDIDPYDFM